MASWGHAWMPFLWLVLHPHFFPVNTFPTPLRQWYLLNLLLSGGGADLGDFWGSLCQHVLRAPS